MSSQQRLVRLIGAVAALAVVVVVAGWFAFGDDDDGTTASRVEPIAPRQAGPSEVRTGPSPGKTRQRPTVGAVPSLDEPPQGLLDARVVARLDFKNEAKRPADCQGIVYANSREAVATVICRPIQNVRVGIWVAGADISKAQFFGYPLRDRDGTIRAVVPLPTTSGRVQVELTRERSRPDATPQRVLERATARLAQVTPG